MPNKNLETYILRELYSHEIFMRKSYAEQLKLLPPGIIKEALERIHKDEIRHCESFKKLLKELDHNWDGKTREIKHRSWNKENIKEMLEFDQRMEEELEGSYMENLNKLELEKEINEDIVKIMKETHAHSEVLKILLAEM